MGENRVPVWWGTSTTTYLPGERKDPPSRAAHRFPYQECPTCLPNSYASNFARHRKDRP